MSENEMNKDEELQRLEQFVEKLLNNFSALKEERNNLIQTLKNRDATIVEKDNAIADRDATIADRESVIADREGTISEREGTIQEREARISELEGMLNDKNHEREEISGKVKSIVEQIESWELSLDEDNESYSPENNNGGEENGNDDGSQERS
jgi:chromosome segregation ATPase